MRPSPPLVSVRRGGSRLPAAIVRAAVALVLAAAIVSTCSGNTRLTPGPTDGCSRGPAFAATAGLPRAALSTEDSDVAGLVLKDPLDPSRRFDHPSWSLAGSLGPFVTDRRGDVYVVASPRMSPRDNPPGALGVVYRVDAMTAEMGPWASLPDAVRAGSGNPFGAVGLAYDCDLDSLLVSSVAGSERSAETGHVFRVELASGRADGGHRAGGAGGTSRPSGTVGEVLSDVDAFGLVTVNVANGKRLYYGLARESEVWSVALDETGSAVGDSRFEVDLPAGRKARRLRVSETDSRLVMRAHVVPFSFDLRVASEKQEDSVWFEVDRATGSVAPLD